MTGKERFSLGNLRNTLPAPIQLLYVLLALAGVGIGVVESAASTTTSVNARVLSLPERRNAASVDLTVAVRDKMTRTERNKLAALGAILRRSGRPGAHALGDAIEALLSGTPGAAATVFAALATQGSSAEREAGEILSKALTDAVTTAGDTSGATQTTINNNDSHFSLTVPSFVLRAKSSSGKQGNTGGSGTGGNGGGGATGGGSDGGTPSRQTSNEPTRTSAAQLPYTP